MSKTTHIFQDFDLLTRFSNDPSYHKERRIVELASKAPKPFGKLIYGLNYPQALVWSKEKRLAMKMSTMYLTAKEYLIESGIPKDLLDIAAIMFDDLGGNPVVEKLRRSVRFICVAWHARTVRVFHLLVDEFRNGKNVTSYGCGSGIVELLALLASGNKEAKLTLVDIDPDNMALTQELIALFRKHGYATDQVSLILDDISKHELPTGTDTVVSIGLLHNYFPLAAASSFTDNWFASGAAKVITDICYDPRLVTNQDAATRIKFVHNVLDWKLGAPDGLLFCSPEELTSSTKSREVQIYDHGANATVVVS